jgi:DNA-directed RNA polymerase specialized sigma subunit, sigma24 homolog
MRHEQARTGSAGTGQDKSVEAGSDAQLKDASRIEPREFAAVFDQHYDAVHRYLARRVGSDLADDLAAETFTTAFDARRRYTLPIRTRPWLVGIATNTLCHHRRRDARRLQAYARLDRPRRLGRRLQGD